MKLTNDHKKSFNEAISTCEIVKAWKKQNNNKASGPDGLPAEYYKVFEDVLLNPYKKTIKYIESQGTLPDSWKEALITLIHKEKTDLKEARN